MEGGGRSGATHAAGFVLVGGRSSRMECDKALLPAGPQTLAEQIAHSVRQAAGSVTLIGDPEKYASLGLPVIADAVKGRGPMGGIYTALLHSKEDWNLVVACDMPDLAPDFLHALIRAAGRSPQSCLVCEGPGGMEPLCAVYHRRAEAVLGAAFARGVRKVTEAFAGLQVTSLTVPEATRFQNINTPEEWADYAPK